MSLRTLIVLWIVGTLLSLTCWAAIIYGVVRAILSLASGH